MCRGHVGSEKTMCGMLERLFVKDISFGDLMGFYSDLMGFYSDLMGFYSDLMGFYSDLMVI